MKSTHHRVRPVPFRFGSQAIHKDAGQQAAQRRGERNQPETMRAHRGPAYASIGDQHRRTVAGQPIEKHSLRELEQKDERLRAQPPDDPQQDRVEQELMLLFQYREIPPVTLAGLAIVLHELLRIFRRDGKHGQEQRAGFDGRASQVDPHAALVPTDGFDPIRFQEHQPFVQPGTGVDDHERDLPSRIVEYKVRHVSDGAVPGLDMIALDFTCAAKVWIAFEDRLRYRRKSSGIDMGPNGSPVQ